jgi:hypothetical protein
MVVLDHQLVDPEAELPRDPSKGFGDIRAPRGRRAPCAASGTRPDGICKRISRDYSCANSRGYPGMDSASERFVAPGCASRLVTRPSDVRQIEGFFVREAFNESHIQANDGLNRSEISEKACDQHYRFVTDLLALFDVTNHLALANLNYRIRNTLDSAHSGSEHSFATDYRAI